jgi:hypothetical protein
MFVSHEKCTVTKKSDKNELCIEKKFVILDEDASKNAKLAKINFL